MTARTAMRRRRRERTVEPDAPAERAVGRLRFAGGFALLMAVYYLVMLLPASDTALYRYLAANATAANWVLRLAGQDTRVSGVTIRAHDYAISVRRGCDGIEPAWMFCAAVLSFPNPWRRKRFVLFAGVALLLALNLVRIVSLFLIGRWTPAWFPAWHLEIWPATFTLTALALWLAWIQRGIKEWPTSSH